jgi:hypothetical protein
MSKSKLVINKQVVRVLTDADVRKVGGASDGFLCDPGISLFVCPSQDCGTYDNCASDGCASATGCGGMTGFVCQS